MEFDVGKFLSAKADFFRVRFKAPALTTSFSSAKFGLKGLDENGLKSVLRFAGIPKERRKAISRLRSKLSGAVQDASIPNVFFGAGLYAIAKNRSGAFLNTLQTLDDEIKAEVAKLVEATEEIEAHIRLGCQAAAEKAISDGVLKDGIVDDPATLANAWANQILKRLKLDRLAPRFGLTYMKVGSISCSLDLSTKEELLADIETAEKAETIRAAQKKLRDEVFSQIGQLAGSIKADYLSALWSGIKGLERNMTCGRARSLRLKLERLKSINVVGDPDLDNMTDNLIDMLSSTEEGGSARVIHAEEAKTLIRKASQEVHDFIEGAFNAPRRLEIDGLEEEIHVNAEAYNSYANGVFDALNSAIEKIEADGDEKDQAQLDKMVRLADLSEKYLAEGYSPAQAVDVMEIGKRFDGFLEEPADSLEAPAVSATESEIAEEAGMSAFASAIELDDDPEVIVEPAEPAIPTPRGIEL